MKSKFENIIRILETMLRKGSGADVHRVANFVCRLKACIYLDQTGKLNLNECERCFKTYSEANQYVIEYFSKAGQKGFQGKNR